MTINTPEEKTLSDKRSGARSVRRGVQAKIEELKTAYAEKDDAIQALCDVESYIDSMIERDKKRKGGLWN